MKNQTMFRPARSGAGANAGTIAVTPCAVDAVDLSQLA